MFRMSAMLSFGVGVSMAETADLESVMMSAVDMLQSLANSKAMLIAASST